MWKLNSNKDFLPADEREHIATSADRQLRFQSSTGAQVGTDFRGSSLYAGDRIVATWSPDELAAAVVGVPAQTAQTAEPVRATRITERMPADVPPIELDAAPSAPARLGPAQHAAQRRASVAAERAQRHAPPFVPPGLPGPAASSMSTEQIESALELALAQAVQRVTGSPAMPSRSDLLRGLLSLFASAQYATVRQAEQAED